MAEEYKTLAHQWFDLVWNQGREDAIERLLAPDAVAHGLVDDSGNEVCGPEAYKPFFARFKGAFPDLRVDVLDTVVEGDLIAARCEVTGTHLGETLGIVATSQPIAITGMTILRVKDGQIAEAWNNFDFAALFTQIAPAPNGPGD